MAAIDRVIFEDAVRATMAAHARAKPGKETGGVLAGYRRDSQLVVTRASPPGPRAVHQARFFSRDSSFLQGWLDDVCDSSRRDEDYVGEWHVHLAFDAPPSTVDRRSLYRIARRANYPTDQPLLVIAEVANTAWRPRGWLFAVEPKRSMREVALTPPATRRRRAARL